MIPLSVVTLWRSQSVDSKQFPYKQSPTDTKYLIGSHLGLMSIWVNLITFTEWYHHQWSHLSASTLLLGGIDLFFLINFAFCFLQQTPTKIGTTISGRRFTGTSRSTESRFAWSGASPASSTGRPGVPTVQSATIASRWVFVNSKPIRFNKFKIL